MVEEDDRVEEDAGVVLRILGREELERHGDHERPQDHAAQAAEAAEDDDRVDGDEDRDVEVARRDGSEERREHAAREARDPCSDAESEELEPVDRNAHRLRRERVLAKRTQGTARAGFAQEVEADQDDDSCHEQHEVLLRPRDELVAEEADGVDVGDPVRPAREPLAGDLGIRRVHEDDERLPEEQRHDRQVVAEEPARRDAEEEPEQRRGDDDERHGDDRRPVDPVVLRREERVEYAPNPKNAT